VCVCVCVCVWPCVCVAVCMRVCDCVCYRIPVRCSSGRERNSYTHTAPGCGVRTHPYTWHRREVIRKCPPTTVMRLRISIEVRALVGVCERGRDVCRSRM
jgi:hypothetical protein